ncbi:hypothetical protein ROLI_011730 [Roseobacter fucihabitans]|uniref:Uncharacterized protein n=1 Tax=Roseobacter fucihabitans TaxID=1537242 RepID=A0ABZ2BQ16_9RHOB|nr:hypothetical protein [Roseobacter litoralis]MBC6964299.1 hypothetical protein [Roseobacter litoralis]
MSAPDTNIDRQTKRHWPAFLGIGVALFVGVLMGLMIAYVADANGPQVTTSSLTDIAPALFAKG